MVLGNWKDSKLMKNLVGQRTFRKVLWGARGTILLLEDFDIKGPPKSQFVMIYLIAGGRVVEYGYIPS